jgi:hypothetical protein
MRVYENVEEPDEWRTTNTLVLNDDGRFLYTTESVCYAGSVTRSVTGGWSQQEQSITLAADQSDLAVWTVGEAREAFEDGDFLRIGGAGLHLPLIRKSG